jgi:hypothetical protein
MAIAYWSGNIKKEEELLKKQKIRQKKKKLQKDSIYNFSLGRLK